MHKNCLHIFMKKQLTLTIKGEFNATEYKNLFADKIWAYNLEKKPPNHPDITGWVDASKESIIYVTCEGEEEDLKIISVIGKRGPVISHITKIE